MMCERKTAWIWGLIVYVFERVDIGDKPGVSAELLDLVLSRSVSILSLSLTRLQPCQRQLERHQTE